MNTRGVAWLLAAPVLCVGPAAAQATEEAMDLLRCAELGPAPPREPAAPADPEDVTPRKAGPGLGDPIYDLPDAYWDRRLAPDGSVIGAGVSSTSVDPARPTFTPFTEAPLMTNRGAVAASLLREHPAHLAALGVGGRVVVWLYLTKEGVVQNAAINLRGPHPDLDTAALRVACGMAFTPARDRGDPVDVWVSVPVVFPSTR